MPNTNRQPVSRAARVALAGARMGALAASLALVAGCQREATAPDDADVVAKVGESVIRVSDVEQELRMRAGRAAPIPGLDTLLDDLVERRLIVDKALADGMADDPELRRSWESLLIGAYKERYLREQLRTIEVGDAEVAAQYQADADRYRRPAKARLAILSLPFTSVMPAEERDAVVARMAEGRELSLATEPAGPGFGTLAVNFSEDQVTRHRGGDAGWLDEGVDYRWPAEVVAAGFALEMGETSQPLVAGDAVYLVRKLDERPATPIELAQVSTQIRKDLLTAKIREAEAAFSNTLRQDVTIETNPERLSGIDVPETARTAAIDEEPPTIP
jgi:parvulin-like peptidyl-prolyl isomerase